MELLRIIYWTLVGFGILALMVILISYTTYLIRKKLGKIPSESIGNEDKIKKIKVSISNRNSPRVKQHHPRVVRRKYHHDDPRAPRKKRKERITILNDLLKEDVLNYNRFRNN